MKTILKLFVFILCVSFANAQEHNGTTITITFDNVPNDKGHVMVSLHTSETFMKGPGIKNTKSTIENGKVKVVFENVGPGIYAIIALHDANDNGRMDFQENGMPLEAYGSSNNPMGFGPPQFAASKFETGNEDLNFHIRF